MILVNTQDAVTFLAPEGATADDRRRLRRMIYNRARDGKITRHGENGKGQALWNLREIRTLKGLL